MPGARVSAMQPDPEQRSTRNQMRKRANGSGRNRETQSGARWEAQNKYVKPAGRTDVNRGGIWRLISPSGKIQWAGSARPSLRRTFAAAATTESRFYARASVPGRLTAAPKIPAAPTRCEKGRTCTAPEFKAHLFYSYLLRLRLQVTNSDMKWPFV